MQIPRSEKQSATAIIPFMFFLPFSNLNIVTWIPSQHDETFLLKVNYQRNSLQGLEICYSVVVILGKNITKRPKGPRSTPAKNNPGTLLFFIFAIKPLKNPKINGKTIARIKGGSIINLTDSLFEKLTNKLQSYSLNLSSDRLTLNLTALSSSQPLADSALLSMSETNGFMSIKGVPSSMSKS